MPKETLREQDNTAIGFLPCFSHYLYNKFPINDFYQNGVFVGKVALILREILTCLNPIVDLKMRTGCKSIMPVTPDSLEGRRIINLCARGEGKLYRLDFGKNKMRVIIGLEDDGRKRLCHFFGFDAAHETYPNGKVRRQIQS